MAKSKRRKKSTKLSQRKKLIQSINRSIKYREKQGYIFDPVFKESISRKQTKTLQEIKKNIGVELAQRSIYVDPLTNKTMKGTQAKSFRRSLAKQKKQARETEETYFQDIDDENFETYLDTETLSIIEWLKTNIMELPDVNRFAKGIAVDYSGYKNRLISYIDDRLISLDVTATQNYMEYIKQNEAPLVTAFEMIKYSSQQTNVEAAYRNVFDILKGGEALTIEEAQEAEELNEYYEDFEDIY